MIILRTIIAVGMMWFAAHAAAKSEAPSVSNPIAKYGVGLRVGLGDLDTTLDNSRIREVIILSVTCHSPADEAGLRVGDQIVSIDGVTIEGLTPEEFHKIFQSPNISVTLLRDGKEKHTIEMTARILQSIDTTCGVSKQGLPI